jgi:hypothetical protein
MWTRFKRRRLLRRPLEAGDEAILDASWPLYRLLSAADRAALAGRTQVLLAEKRFEGCAGLAVTSDMRLLILAQAALLLLGREEDFFYPGLRTVLVYPDPFVVPCRDADELGVVAEGEEVRSGESWERGVVVLAWDEVRSSAAAAPGEFNVTLHEFAHQLDAAWGYTNQAGIAAVRPSEETWARVMTDAYRRLQREVRMGREPVLDPYGAEHPAEFFAVAAECFFQDARRLREGLPELYEALRGFYGQDPACWPWELLEPQTVPEPGKRPRRKEKKRPLP